MESRLELLLEFLINGIVQFLHHPSGNRKVAKL